MEEPDAPCWRRAPRSAPSPPSASAASRPTNCSMPAAAARCAASSIKAPARATPSTIPWAAPASSKRSVELRQRIGKSFGAVAFVDAGSAYPDYLPNFSLFAPRVGAGAGIRYYTDFGPIRSTSACRSTGARAIHRSASMSASGSRSDARAPSPVVGAGAVAGLLVLAFGFLQTPPGQRMLASALSAAASTRNAASSSVASPASSRPTFAWRGSNSPTAAGRGSPSPMHTCSGRSRRCCRAACASRNSRRRASISCVRLSLRKRLMRRRPNGNRRGCRWASTCRRCRSTISTSPQHWRAPTRAGGWRATRSCRPTWRGQAAPERRSHRRQDRPPNRGHPLRCRPAHGRRRDRARRRAGRRGGGAAGEARA